MLRQNFSETPSLLGSFQNGLTHLKEASVARARAIVLREEEVRLTDYDNGFEAQLLGASFDFEKPLAWRRGWLEADTQRIDPRTRRDDMEMRERNRQEQDFADRDNGFEARLANRALDSNETTAWQRGWLVAERSLIEERYDRQHQRKA